MSKMINIEELHREQDRKEQNKSEIFLTILEKVHQKIKFTSQVSKDKFCFFSVPTYVYGLPLFDINSCIIYLTKTLTDNGFDIKYTHPNLLLISWLQKPQKQTNINNGNNYNGLNSMQKLEDVRRRALEYRPTTEYQPSNNFVYDSNSLNTLKEKANKLLYDPRF
jgi:hypothetical protein